MTTKEIPNIRVLAAQVSELQQKASSIRGTNKTNREYRWKILGEINTIVYTIATITGENPDVVKATLTTIASTNS